MTPDQANVLAQAYISQLEMESKTTLRVLEAVPNDQAEYKPHEKNMSAGELAAHAALVEIWFLDGIIKGGFAMPEGEMPKPSPAEAAAMYREQIPGLIAKLKALSPEHLAKNAQFYVFNLSLAEYIGFCLNHTIHHRGQLSVYLRPMGAKVPSIYGGSADEPMTGAAQA